MSFVASPNVLNVGVAGEPIVGPANTVFILCVARVADNVPEEVTGEPVTENMEGRDRPTEVTVPPEDNVAQVDPLYNSNTLSDELYLIAPADAVGR